jgi:hypothetical protein
MYIDGASSPQITHSTIRHNQYGVIVRNFYDNVPNPIINQSNLYDNSEYNYYLGSYGYYWNQVAPDAVLDATDNWWGTSNEQVIQETIYDYTDDSRLATVDYDPWQIQACIYDDDEDGDVDGSDLFNFMLIQPSTNLNDFASEYGRINCQ